MTPLADWHSACVAALAGGATYFDMLSAAELIDGSGVEVTLHAAVPGTPIGHVLLTTRVPYGDALPSIADVWKGAAWHEREIHEMFGVAIEGHPDLRPLLLDDPDSHPLRKANNLITRAETPWPGREGRKKPLGVPEQR